MRQARFWHCADNGPVRIKLNIGQTVRHSHGGATDEGYHWVNDVWSFDGDVVTNVWTTESKDCDGRMSRSGIALCSVAQLATGHHSAEDAVTYPEWMHGDERQRDHAAEAMNY